MSCDCDALKDGLSFHPDTNCEELGYPWNRLCQLERDLKAVVERHERDLARVGRERDHARAGCKRLEEEGGRLRCEMSGIAGQREDFKRQRDKALEELAALRRSYSELEGMVHRGVQYRPKNHVTPRIVQVSKDGLMTGHFEPDEVTLIF